jgi:Ca2+-binding EF-hand superfamily protein
MKLVITLLALLISTSLACAADKEKPKRPGDSKRAPDAFFKSVDKNGDGFVSRDEYMADPRAKQSPKTAETNFPRLDKDKDGKLSKDEFNGTTGKGKGDAK